MTKSIKGYSIAAKVDGKSWLTKCTTLTAANIEEAKQKAINILNLTPEHQIEVKSIELFNTDTILTTDSYPYGRLKCTATFSTELTKNGYRSVFQTINPKTGRLNAPKKSTYYKSLFLCKDDSGHISHTGHNSFNGTEEINEGLHFLNDFFDLLTESEVKDFAITICAMLQVDLKAKVIYAGLDFETLKPYYTPQIKTAVQIAKTGQNLFLDCIIDADSVNKMKDPNFNPFTISSRS